MENYNVKLESLLYLKYEVQNDTKSGGNYDQGDYNWLRLFDRTEV